MSFVKKTAFVLGGTVPHIELVRQLKERGYYCVLIDYLSSPPAKEFADEHIQESTLDKDRVLELAKKQEVSLVISGCVDQANATACYVAEKLGLPHPYSFDTAMKVTNKGLMKGAFTRHGVPTAEYVLVKNANEAEACCLSFPLVVKPVDCNSSKGVRRVENKSELLRAVTDALALTRSGEVLIEQFLDGKEISVDCYVGDGDTAVIMTREKQKIRLISGHVLQSYGSMYPADLQPHIQRSLSIIADNIARGFGLCRTPFFFQAILTANGLCVLEFAPRIGGGVSYYVIPYLTGFDIISAEIKSYFGKLSNLDYHEPNGLFASLMIHMKPGLYDHIEGLEDLKQEGVIESYYVTKKKGTQIASGIESGNRVAMMLIQGKNKIELDERRVIAVNHIKVIDHHGEDLMFRELYKFD
jgi:biotin carboxylase